jgi:hypothetical protein
VNPINKPKGVATLHVDVFCVHNFELENGKHRALSQCAGDGTFTRDQELPYIEAPSKTDRMTGCPALANRAFTRTNWSFCRPGQVLPMRHFGSARNIKVIPCGLLSAHPPGQRTPVSVIAGGQGRRTAFATSAPFVNL